jgi:hypothetical protein
MLKSNVHMNGISLNTPFFSWRLHIPGSWAQTAPYFRGPCAEN